MAERYSDLSIRFFAGPGSSLRSLQPEMDRLTTTDPALRASLLQTGGAGEILEDDYDAFCILGAGVTHQSLMRLYDRYRAESHLSRAGEFDLVSDVCFEAASRGLTSRTFAVLVLGHLRAITSKPIYLVPPPMPSETILGDPIKRHPWAHARDGGDEAILSAHFKRLLDPYVGSGPPPIFQPQETLASQMLSQERYSTGSRRLLDEGDVHPDTDYFHMNAQFGELILMNFISVASAQEIAAA